MANEIELLVSIRRSGDQGLKRRGDILTARLAGDIWGSEEIKVHQVVLWPSEDAAQIETQSTQLLIAILNKKKEWGEPNPRVDFPFCEIITEKEEDDEGNAYKDFDGNDVTRIIMTNRSVLHFDFSLLSQSQIAQVLDKNVVAADITSSQVSIHVDERGIDKREPEDRGEKEHRDAGPNNPVIHASTALRRDETTDVQEFLSREVEKLKSWSV